MVIHDGISPREVIGSTSNEDRAREIHIAAVPDVPRLSRGGGSGRGGGRGAEDSWELAAR